MLTSFGNCYRIKTILDVSPSDSENRRIFPERRNTMKASFENAKIDVVLFSNEDVVTGSPGTGDWASIDDPEI